MTELKRTRTRPDDPGLIGQVLGNFRIVAPLSSGGMGVVYRARHEALGRPAAIKVLRPELTGSQELVQRFFTEAKAASAIRHPGIVETLDFGYTEDGLAFIVMELLEGQSLAHRLRDKKRFPEQVAAAVARGIASALTAAHGKGIIHRDLKPDNIFLVPDPDVMFGERPKILDFGIAKLNDPSETHVRHTRTGVLIGTPLYMAPEQARAASEIDHRADLYSLGCILYEMLVGAPPFVAEGAGEIIAMQMFATPEPPTVRLPSLSPDLEQITLRLLDKEPAGRFASAAQVADALGGVLGRLSGELANVMPSAGASLPSALYTPSPAASSPSVLQGRLPLLDEPARVEKRSALMPLIAGVMTLLIAGAAVVLVWNRSAAAPAPAAARDAGVAAIVAVDAAAVAPAIPAQAPDAAVVTPVITSGSDEAIVHAPVRPTRPPPPPVHRDPLAPGPHDVPVTMPAHDPEPPVVPTAGSAQPHDDKHDDLKHKPIEPSLDPVPPPPPATP